MMIALVVGVWVIVVLLFLIMIILIGHGTDHDETNRLLKRLAYSEYR